MSHPLFLGMSYEEIVKSRLQHYRINCRQCGQVVFTRKSNHKVCENCKNPDSPNLKTCEWCSYTYCNYVEFGGKFDACWSHQQYAGERDAHEQRTREIIAKDCEFCHESYQDMRQSKVTKCPVCTQTTLDLYQDTIDKSMVHANRGICVTFSDSLEKSFFVLCEIKQEHIDQCGYIKNCK